NSAVIIYFYFLSLHDARPILIFAKKITAYKWALFFNFVILNFYYMAFRSSNFRFKCFLLLDIYSYWKILKSSLWLKKSFLKARKNMLVIFCTSKRVSFMFGQK